MLKLAFLRLHWMFDTKQLVLRPADKRGVPKGNVAKVAMALGIDHSPVQEAVNDSKNEECIGVKHDGDAGMVGCAQERGATGRHLTGALEGGADDRLRCCPECTRILLIVTYYLLNTLLLVQVLIALDYRYFTTTIALLVITSTIHRG